MKLFTIKLEHVIEIKNSEDERRHTELLRHIMELNRWVGNIGVKMDGLKETLNTIKITQSLLINKIDTMAKVTQADFDKVFQAINDETTTIGTDLNGVASRMSELQDVVKGLGLGADAESAILSKLQGIPDSLKAVGDKLVALASDPANPIPVPTTPTTPVDEGSGTDTGTSDGGTGSGTSNDSGTADAGNTGTDSGSADSGSTNG